MTVGVQTRILISGSSGLIGSELVRALRRRGASVTQLTRRLADADEISWQPETSEISPHLVSGFDAVIHLAGEPVGTRRWTAQKKQAIYDSRILGTRTITKALALAADPPKVFLCASGINYYPSSGDRVLDESAGPGTGFLSKVCLDWEQAAEDLSAVSRVALMRIGVVLSSDGGTLEKMLPMFRFGLGGYVGSGASYVSWITLSDLVHAVIHILQSASLQGPVNVVSPEPVTGKEFAQALGNAVGRWAGLRVPEFVPRLALGEFAEETILSSVRAVPCRLVSTGFTFRSATVQDAFVECLQRTQRVDGGE